MSDRLEQALSFANYRQTLNNQFHQVRTRAESLLTVAKNGGNFVIDRELMCFLDMFARDGRTSIVLLDVNQTPIEITDIPAFLKEITQRYFEVTNDYLAEYQTIRKSRSVKTIVDLKAE